ncbi:unnamed protein product [Bemisia tabaci]|uniref:Uncharacterized protein n=1 Tax=Bemisia tabaci TaxID=7038 RepID=A0A9P0AH20_BEMTA|nr:unnamed protein product [Bemisia tabaci]
MGACTIYNFKLWLFKFYFADSRPPVKLISQRPRQLSFEVSALG